MPYSAPPCPAAGKTRFNPRPMPTISFHNRAAVSIENHWLRVTVLREGGHIAEIRDKALDINPLWAPPWTTMEPSAHPIRDAPTFGQGPDAKLLAGIMGHNVCLDLFGATSGEEFREGIPTHGEVSVEPYTITETPRSLTARVELPLAQLRFERVITLDERNVHIRETVDNFRADDRPIAWTQHVTFGPPFLSPSTHFQASVDRSLVSATDPGQDAYLLANAEFRWPFVPRREGGTSDLRQIHPTAPASAYTVHLTSPSPHAFFTAYSAEHQFALSYLWHRDDFPWLGIWEENCSRTITPWDARTLARGLEFGVSPFPETCREMISRPPLFGAPMYKWLPAKGSLSAEYWITTQIVESEPGPSHWPGSTT